MNKMVPDHVQQANQRASHAAALRFSPAALFQGYDSITNSVRPAAVKSGQTSAGAAARSYCTVCTDIEALKSALNISASIAAPFGFGSVGPKSGFMASLKVTTTSVCVVIYASAVTGGGAATDAAFAAPPPADMNAFFRAHGDSWVSQLVLGAEYMAVHVFYSQSIAQQESVIRTLAANGITSGGDINGFLQASLYTACCQITAQQSVHQFLSGHSQLKRPAADKIVPFADGFSRRTPDAPTVISFALTGYERAPGMPDEFLSVVSTRNMVIGSGKRPGLASQFARLNAVADGVDHIQALYDLYGAPADAALLDKLTQIEQDIGALTSLFERMDRIPAATYAPPPLPSLAHGAPALSYVVKTARLGGGAGGVPFQDADSPDVLAGTRIRVVSGKGGARVDQIATTYLNAQDAVTQIHGGESGDQGPCLILGRQERIVSVTGTPVRNRTANAESSRFYARGSCECSQ